MAELTEDDIKKLPADKQAIARSILERRKRQAEGTESGRNQLRPYNAEEAKANEPGFWEDLGSKANSLVKGATEGLTFNMGNEISGVLGAADEAIRSAGKDTGQFQGLPLWQRMMKRYDMESEAWKKDLQDAQEANPDTFLVGELGGSLLTPMPSGIANAGGRVGANIASRIASPRAAKAVAKVAERAGEGAAGKMAAMAAKGVEKAAETGAKYGGLAAEGAAMGAASGFGSGEGLEGSIETGFHGGLMGGGLAPVMSAAGNAIYGGGKKLINQTGDFLQNEAEREVLRSGMSKADLMKLPKHKRQELARDILNMRDNKGRWAVRFGDNAEDMLDRLAGLMKSLGVTGEEMLRYGDDKIGAALGLPSGDAESIRRLRGLFRDADNMRIARSEGKMHEVEADELRRLRAERENAQKGYVESQNAGKMLDASAREKDAVEQLNRARAIEAVKPGEKLGGMPITGESLANQFTRAKKNAGELAGVLAKDANAGGGSILSKEEAAKVSEMLGKLKDDERADYLYSIAERMVKNRDPRVTGIEFSAGKLTDMPSEILYLSDKPIPEAIKQAYRRNPSALPLSPEMRPSSRALSNFDRGNDLDFTLRARMEAGEVPMPFRNEIAATGVTPDLTKPKLKTDKQISKEAREYAASTIPEADLKPEAGLTDDIGINIKPMLAELRGKLGVMLESPNLDLEKRARVEALLKKWDQKAEEGVSLEKLRKFKTDADRDLVNLNKSDIDQDVVLAIRGAIDDTVEKELKNAAGPTILSAYGNNKRNYGALKEYLKGVDRLDNANNGNSFFSLRDNLTTGAVGNALLGGAAVAGFGEGIKDGNWGVGTLAAIPAVALTHRLVRQRGNAALARSLDASGRALEGASNRLTPELKEKASKFFQLEGRSPPGSGITAAYQRAVSAEQGVDRKETTRSGRVQALLQKDPTALGAIGPMLLEAVAKDAKAGNQNNEELKAAIFLNKDRLPSDSELERLLGAAQ